MLLGYARVSTNTQEHDLQLDALRAAGAERIFTETASGAKDDRPELKRLLDQARKGDVVLVWKIDRLGRSLVHLVQTVQMLNDQGVQLRSLTENIIDTTSPGGKLIYGMFALMAQFERDQGRQRTIAGLAAAKARGRMGGRPKSLNDDDLKTARALMASGDFSFQVVADKVGVARQTLWRALKAADDRQIESHRP